MSYCTKAQMIERYGEQLLIAVSDRGTSPTGTVDDALVTRAIADAGALIDGYLAARYGLPLASTPQLVADLALRVSIYYAHANTVGDKIKDDYASALKQLREIADGKIRLDLAGTEPAASGGGEVIMSDPERPLSTQALKGFI